MRKLLNIWTLIVTAVLLMGAGTTYYSFKATDTIQIGGINLGHESDTTLTRSAAGVLAVEGANVYTAGGTDVAVTDGGTGASTAAAAATNLGVGTTDSPIFATAKLSGLADGKIPYHVDDATGLADGPTKTDVDDAVSKKHVQNTDTGTNQTLFTVAGELKSKSLQSTAPLGSELVTDGGFASDLSNWTSINWTWNAGTALHTTTHTDALSQSISVTNGETYQVSFTISGRTAGSVTFNVGGVYIYNYGASTAFTGSAARSFIANGTGAQTLAITPTADFDGAIDNVSVKQITGGRQAGITVLDDDGEVAVEIAGDKGLQNTFSGYQAGYYNTTGSHNTFLGLQAGFSNTTGYWNVFSGHQAGYFNTTGHRNVFSGFQAGYSNTTGYYNTFLGLQAGFSNTTGYWNVFSGFQAGYSNTTGYYNTFSGYQAGYYNTTGSHNTFSGYQAGYSNTTGYWNVFSGHQAGYFNTTGHRNVFSGFQAGYSNTTGYYNTFSGYQAGYSNTTGSHNTFSGLQAGFSNTTGYWNVFSGYQAGMYIANGSDNTSSDYCVLIGDNTRVEADNDQNEIVIGYNAIGNGSNTVTLGNTSISELHCQTALTVDSDRRVKKDTTENTIGLEFLNKLNPVTFKKLNPADYPEEIKPPEYKQRTVKELEDIIDEKTGQTIQKEIEVVLEPDPRPKDDQHTYTGLVAQDVETALSESGLDISLVTTSGQGKKGITYENLIPILITAVQELSAKVAKLENTSKAK